MRDDYSFEGPDGRRSLPELFGGRSQLILYQFFFEEVTPPGALAVRPPPSARRRVDPDDRP